MTTLKLPQGRWGRDNNASRDLGKDSGPPGFLFRAGQRVNIVIYRHVVIFFFRMTGRVRGIRMRTSTVQ